METDFELNLLRRPRRLRKSAGIRKLVEETAIGVNDLIAPLFVKEGAGAPEAVASMPGVFRLNLEDLLKECEELQGLGIPAVALFSQVDAF